MSDSKPSDPNLTGEDHVRRLSEPGSKFYKNPNHSTNGRNENGRTESGRKQNDKQNISKEKREDSERRRDAFFKITRAAIMENLQRALLSKDEDKVQFVFNQLYESTNEFHERADGELGRPEFVMKMPWSLQDEGLPEAQVPDFLSTTVDGDALSDDIKRALLPKVADDVRSHLLHGTNNDELIKQYKNFHQQELACYGGGLNELTLKVREDLYTKISDSVSAEIEQDVRRDLRNHFKETLKPEVETQVRDKLATTLNGSIEASVRKDLTKKFEKELRDPIRNEVRERIELDVIDTVTDAAKNELAPKIRDQVKHQLEVDFIDELEPTVREAVRDNLAKELRVSLQPEVEAEVRKETEVEYYEY